MNDVIMLLNESGRWLVPQLGRMSVELAILAVVVLAALYVLRVKSPAPRHLFLCLLLVKPVVTLLVASPLSLYPMPGVMAWESALVPPGVVADQLAPVREAGVAEESPAPVSFWRAIDRYGAFFALWALIAGLLGMRLLLGCAYVTFLRSTATRQLDGPLARIVSEASLTLRTSRRVHIATTRIAHGPVLAGILRPVILLDETMAASLTSNQLRLIVMHELAHAKRWDNLVLLVQRLAEVFLFFHPVVWICGWLMRREAEAACDDMVVSACGETAGAAYADSLTRVAEIRCGITHHLLVNTFAAAESDFHRRIRRILSGGGTRMTLWLGMATGAVFVLIGVVGLPSALSAPNTVSAAQAPAFVDDPAAVGAWESVDFVDAIEAFQPETKSFKGDLYLKGLEIMPGGRTSGPWSWSKGVLHHPGDNTDEHYSIQAMGGARYLFMEWKSGDVTIRGMKPKYYVMQFKAPSTAKALDNSPVDPKQYLSEQAPAFVDDPNVIGRWESVDFIADPADFQPSQKKWTGDLYLTALEFQPQGRMVSYVTGGRSFNGMLWSNGVTWHPGDHTLSKYRIGNIPEGQFLAFEWISGDVTKRGMRPWYYILKRVH